MATLDRSTRVWLFYLKHLLGQRGQLSVNITREICQHLADTLVLIQVTPTFLRFLTSAWQPQVPLHTPIQVDNNSTWVLLEDGRLFCSGGVSLQFSLDAYLLSRNGAVEQLPNMITARYSHGVIQVLHIYIFGGSCKSKYRTVYTVKKCEMIELNNRTWKALPDMREGRSYFNPCLFHGFVYLCGSGSRLVEAFCPQTNSFLPQPLQLHQVYSACCLYVHNNLLVVHSYSYLSRFTAELSGHLLPHSQVKSSAVEKYSNCQPFVMPIQGLFYIFHQTEAVAIEMETGRLVQKFP